MINNFYTEIKNQANKESQNANAKYFKITVSFDDGTHFNPNWKSFEASITKLFSNSLETLDKIKRLLDLTNSTDFSSYVDLSQYDLKNFKQLSNIFTNDEK